MCSLKASLPVLLFLSVMGQFAVAQPQNKVCSFLLNTSTDIKNWVLYSGVAGAKQVSAAEKMSPFIADQSEGHIPEFSLRLLSYNTKTNRRFGEILSRRPVSIRPLGMANILAKDSTVRTVAGGLLTAKGSRAMWVHPSPASAQTLLSESRIEFSPREVGLISYRSADGSAEESEMIISHDADIDWIPYIRTFDQLALRLQQLGIIDKKSRPVKVAKYWEFEHTHPVTNLIIHNGQGQTEAIVTPLSESDFQGARVHSLRTSIPFMVTAHTPNGISFSALYQNGKNITDQIEDYL